MSPVAARRPAAVRLAGSQEAMWELICSCSPSDPGRTPYNVFDVATWNFQVDDDVFRAAVGDVMRRHDALRIVFTDTSLDPRIRVESEVDTPITFADLASQPAERRTALRASILAYERGRTFDLRSGPLWRATLLPVDDTTYLVAVSMSHLIADGWSTGVFLRDLRAAYLARTGHGPPLPALRLPYEAAMAPPEVDEAGRRRRAEYWKRHLTPLPDAWPFPPALADPGVDVTAEANLGLPITGEVVGGLRAFARRQRITPFVLYLAAYRILLGARTGWSRLVIASATAGRDAIGAGVEDLIGQFSQNSYIASTIDPRATLTEAIDTVRASTYEAMRHAGSYYEIARAVNPDFDTMRPWPFLLLYHAWFQSDPPEADPRPPDRPYERRSRNRPPPVPPDVDMLRLWAKRGEPALIVRHDRRGAVMNYNPTIYPRPAMVETLQGYTAVLAALLADPDQRIRDLRLS